MLKLILALILMFSFSAFAVTDEHQTYEECVSEQTDLIYENEDSYSAEEVADQFSDIPQLCEDYK